jgi:hypothetical protein
MLSSLDVKFGSEEWRNVINGAAQTFTITFNIETHNWTKGS